MYSACSTCQWLSPCEPSFGSRDPVSYTATRQIWLLAFGYIICNCSCHIDESIPSHQVNKMKRQCVFSFCLQWYFLTEMKFVSRMILLTQWYYRKFCLKATKSFSSKTDDNSNKEVQNFNFASAIAQILNSLQNLLPIVYIIWSFVWMHRRYIQAKLMFIQTVMPLFITDLR